MPDRPKSTPPPPESARETVFRRTYLAQFDDPRDRAALQGFGDLLSTLAFAGGYLGPRDRNLYAGQLAAVAEDLDALSAFCQEVSEEPTHSEVGAEDLDLCRLAKDVSAQLSDVVSGLRAQLDDIEGVPAATRPLGDEIREAERHVRTMADHHPDPKARQLYRQLADRAAKKGRGK